MTLSGLRLALVLLVASTACGFASAQGTPAGSEIPRASQPSFDPGVIFGSWDRNGDGVVTRDELPDRRAAFRFEEFVRRAGITDGRLTREAFFRAFHERMTELTRRSASDAERLMRFYDRDGDGKLNAQELQPTTRLKTEVARWDRNGDSLIDLTELQAVLEAYAQERLLGIVPGPPGNPAPNRPEAREPGDPAAPGQNPTALPEWFAHLDADKDGQIALHEWKTMPLELFKQIDRNGDGILTADEVLRWQTATARR